MWDEEECGLEWIAVPRKLLWVPDIVINEFMGQNTAPEVPYTYLHFKGGVYDQQPVKVVSSCRLDIYLFPFDIQNCTFTFNSYILDMDAIQLYSGNSAKEILQASKEAMATMGEWELVGITSDLKTIRPMDGSAYQELHFYISVRRQPVMYVVNLLIPSCFLITVDLFSFMLPAQNIDRSLFKMTLILGYTVFLLSTNDLLPITGNTIPLINVFLSLCLSMMVTSLLETVFITNLLCGSAHYTPPPRWIRVLVLHFLGRLVGLPSKPTELEDTVIQNPDAQEMNDFSQVAKANETSEQKELLNGDMMVQVLKELSGDLQAIHHQVIHELKGGRSSEEWIQVGLIIDRLLFILYIIFITVSFITIIIIWVKSYNSI
ncbi:5-hydroxytryptamine receptor 3E-like [Nematolebias whitei]|uniref:5-hydroxytryptamine receptor 3E-like n=1 Tax=Nematolebias whitei TaxID=451745 RepID=UPI0018998E38|nr:5-hydroxytryptamine receptor 3E-like [Nematolebias whitei]